MSLLVSPLFDLSSPASFLPTPVSPRRYIPTNAPRSPSQHTRNRRPARFASRPLGTRELLPTLRAAPRRPCPLLDSPSPTAPTESCLVRRSESTSNPNPGRENLRLDPARGCYALCIPAVDSTSSSFFYSCRTVCSSRPLLYYTSVHFSASSLDSSPFWFGPLFENTIIFSRHRPDSSSRCKAEGKKGPCRRGGVIVLRERREDTPAPFALALSSHQYSHLQHSSSSHNAVCGGSQSV